MVEGEFNGIEIPKQNNVIFDITPETNSNWIMVKSADHVFNELYKKGHNKIVLWDIMPDNSYSYTIGKKSEFIDFPIIDILDTLNREESGWGGGSTIGGSPRNSDGSRSKIKPENIVSIINACLK